MGNQESEAVEPIREKENKYHMEYQSHSKKSKANMEVQSFVSEVVYKQWSKTLEQTVSKFKQNQPKLSRVKIGRLLLPSRHNYQTHGGICGQNQGKAILQFQGGFERLDEALQKHYCSNVPFTTSELWNILFSLVEIASIFRNYPNFISLQSENIYIDRFVKKVKIGSSQSFLMNSNTNSKSKFIDCEKLQLLIRKLNVPVAVENRSDDFAVGMMMLECLLLERCLLIYEDGLSQHRTINHTVHEHLVQKIIKTSYYPIKLRMIIVGLVQLDSRLRFTCEQVYQLLQESKGFIQNFDEFHISKDKIHAIDQIVRKLKKDNCQQLFKKGFTSLPCHPQPTRHQQKFLPISLNIEAPLPYSNKSEGSQSFNISWTNIGQTHKNHDDFESLNLSKSERRSSDNQNNQHLLKNVTNPSYFSQVMNDSPPTQDKIKEVVHSNSEEIQNLFDNFQESSSSKKSKSQRSGSQLPAQPKQMQIEQFHQISMENILIKEEEKAVVQPLIEKIEDKQQKQEQIQIIQNVQKEQQEHEEEEILMKSESHQSQSILQENPVQISHNSSKSHTIKDEDIQNEEPIEVDDRISNKDSEVVFYKSQLYEAEQNQGLNQSLTARESEQQSECRPIDFQEYEPFNSRQIDQNDSKYSRFSNSHKDESKINVRHRDSIINKLDPLLSSKKLEPQIVVQPEFVSESAKRKLEYLSMLKKFSPEVIGQLSYSSNFPETQKLKRQMREKISIHEAVMSNSKKLFPDPAPSHTL